MIMQAALALAICSLVVEGVIVWYLPAVHRFYNSSDKGMLLNVFSSVALSYVLGIMFGAGGLITMMGAIMSTAASALGFHKLTYLMKENLPEIQSGWHQITGKVSSAGKDLLGFIQFLLAIPIRIGRAYNWCVLRTRQVKTFSTSLKKGISTS